MPAPIPSPETIKNIDLYTDLRWEFDKFDTLLARSISKAQPLCQSLVLLRRKIRLGRAYEAIKDQHYSGESFRSLAAHAYRYFELIYKLEKAQYLSREKAVKLTIRAARLLELTDPKVAKLFGVQD